jgi:lipoprotein-anchoring transpeptidase ErfK/SrfK
MRQQGLAAGLRTLSVLYVLGVSALGFGLAVQAQHPWALDAKHAAEAAPPAIGAAAGSVARAANDHLLQPAWAWTVKTANDAWRALDNRLWPKPQALPKVASAKPPVKKAPLVLHPAPVTPPAAVAKPPATAEAPKMELAEPETVPLVPAPDNAPPSPGEVARVLSHLKESLTTELLTNFELFLYVSKADHGPWRQRLFAFTKETGGGLRMIYSFPVSTGKEVLTPNPDGNALWNTDTPTGYFQLDPERVYKRYTSHQWGHKMPFAMFFSWEHDGRQTGVAIHSAVGDDIALLGNRASAGCVRLAPQNAEILYRLIKSNYKGLTPLFAYDKRTATMSKEGLLMHDKAGNIQYAEGYKVLVLIENKGGDDLIAALF